MDSFATVIVIRTDSKRFFFNSFSFSSRSSVTYDYIRDYNNYTHVFDNVFLKLTTANKIELLWNTLFPERQPKLKITTFQNVYYQFNLTQLKMIINLPGLAYSCWLSLDRYSYTHIHMIHNIISVYCHMLITHHKRLIRTYHYNYNEI